MNNTSIQLPVRGNDTVEILTNDHDAIKTLFADLTKATAADGRKEAFERLKAALVIHNATEENLVYPALRMVAHEKLESETLYHQTAEASVLVFELDSMLKAGEDSDFGVKAAKLQDAVLAHIKEEETTAFPELQKASDSKHAAELTASIRKFRGAFQIVA